MKSILFALSLLASCTANVPAYASTLAEIANSTLKLYRADASGFCSATVVGPRTLLTANHCSDEKGTNVRLQTLDEKYDVVSERVIYLKTVKTLKGPDVAILEPLDKNINFAELGNIPVDIANPQEVTDNVRFGTEVLAVGYPAALELTVTEGLFGQPTRTPAAGMWDTPVYRFTSPITGGNSGGGLYAEIDGEKKLIGVTVGGYNTAGAFMNIASPIEGIQAVLKGFVEAKTVEQIKASDTPGVGIDAR